MDEVVFKRQEEWTTIPKELSMEWNALMCYIHKLIKGCYSHEINYYCHDILYIHLSCYSYVTYKQIQCEFIWRADDYSCFSGKEQKRQGLWAPVVQQTFIRHSDVGQTLGLMLGIKWMNTAGSLISSMSSWSFGGGRWTSKKIKN